METTIIQKFKAEINGFEFTNEVEYWEVRNTIESIEKFYDIKIKTFGGVKFVKYTLYDVANKIDEDFLYPSWKDKVERASYMMLDSYSFIKSLGRSEKFEVSIDI